MRLLLKFYETGYLRIQNINTKESSKFIENSLFLHSQLLLSLHVVISITQRKITSLPHNSFSLLIIGDVRIKKS